MFNCLIYNAMLYLSIPDVRACQKVETLQVLSRCYLDICYLSGPKEFYPAIDALQVSKELRCLSYQTTCLSNTQRNWISILICMLTSNCKYRQYCNVLYFELTKYTCSVYVNNIAIFIFRKHGAKGKNRVDFSVFERIPIALKQMR